MSSNDLQALVQRQSALRSRLHQIRAVRPRSLRHRLRGLYVAIDLIDPDLISTTPSSWWPILLAEVAWVRPLWAWSTPGWDALIRHLLFTVQYPLQATLMQAPLRSLGQFEAERALRLLAHLGQGGSVRQARKKRLLPPCLTRKMDHHLLTLTTPMNLTQAIRHAQVAALGGAPALAEHINGTLLRDRLSDPEEAWWQEVIGWLCTKPLFPYNRLGNVFDWMANRRNAYDPYLPRSIGALRRRLRVLTAPQALNASQRWHQQNNPRASNRGRRKRSVPLPESEIAGWELKSKDDRWTIRQIGSSDELAQEGRKLSHCVGTYLGRALQRRSVIFSFRKNNTRLLTVEVRPGTNQIVQARGFHNRAPTKEERWMLRLWANRAGLTVLCV